MPQDSSTISRTPRPQIPTGRPTVMHRVGHSRPPPALPAAAHSDGTSTVQAGIWSDRLRRVARLLRPSPKSRASYYDPLFERPDLIEDDYYRLRTQPRG